MNRLRGYAAVVTLLLIGCPNANTRTDSRAVISGHVVLEDEPGLNDMSRVKINLGRGEGDVTPADDGQFEFSDVEPDVYNLTVTYVGGLTPTATHSAYQRYTRRVVARAGSVSDIGTVNPLLAKGGITGNVVIPANSRGQDGGPSSADGVVIEVHTHKGAVLTTTTNSAGAFTFTDVPVGTHTIQAQIPATLAKGRGQAGCTPTVVVGEEAEMVPAPVLSISDTRPSFLPGLDETVPDPLSTTWTIRGRDTLHVNAVAGFGSLQRAWPAGTDAPPYELAPGTEGNPFFIQGITEGRHPYSFQFSDGCNYESPIFTIEIVRDDTPPTITLLTLNDGVTVSSMTPVAVSLLAVDALAPRLTMATTACPVVNNACACNPDLPSVTTGLAYNPLTTLPLQDGDWCVRARVWDVAGNPSAVKDTRITIDATAPPVPAIQIGLGGMPAVITSATVPIHVDASGNPTRMKVAETNLGAATWEGFRSDFTWTFSDATEGIKTLQVLTEDAAGNPAPNAGSATAMLYTTGHIVGRVLMPDGTMAAGGTVTTMDGRNTTTIGADGVFDLQCPAGTAILDIAPPTPVMGTRQRAGTDTRTVQVPVHDTANVHDVQLPWLRGALVGRILLAGQPASTGNAGATVLVVSSPGLVPQPTTGTLPDGTWRMDGLISGLYSVSVQKDLYESKSLGVFEVFGSADTSVPEDTLRRVRGFSIDGGRTHTGDLTVSITVFADTGTQLLISEDDTFANAVPLAFVSGTPFDFDLQPGDGLKTVHVRVLGDANGDRSSQIILDTQRPVASDAQLILNRGDPFSLVESVRAQLVLSAQDPNIEFVHISTDGVNFGGNVRIQDFSDHDFTLQPAVANGAHGDRSVSLRFVDFAGNESLDSLSGHVYVDKAPPAFGVISVVGAVAGNVVRDLTVLLSIDATDACAAAYPLPCANNTAVPKQITFSSVMNFTGATPRDFGPVTPATHVWYLNPVATPQTVYLTLTDGAGNTAQTNVTITLDQDPPTNARVLLPALINTSSVLAQPRATGAAEYRMAATQDALATAIWKPYNDTVEESVALDGAEGVHSVYAEFRDVAGNVARAEGRTTVDHTPPQLASVTVLEVPGTFLQDNVSALTRLTQVDLRTIATDANGVQYLFIREGDTNFTTLDRRAYTAAAVTVPTSSEGVHALHIRVVDMAGNPTDATFTVTRDSVPPTAPTSVRVTPRPNQFPARPLQAPGTNHDVTNDVFPLFGWTGASSDTVRVVVEAARGTTFATAPLTAVPDLAAVGSGALGDLYLAGVLDDGAWSFRVVAEDAAGNRSATAGFVFDVDTLPPAEPVVTFVARGTSTPALQFSTVPGVDVLVTSTEGSPTRYTLWMDGEFSEAVYNQPYSTTRIPLTLSGGNGPKTVRAQFVDAAGNRSTVTSRTVVVTLDTQAPTIFVFSVPAVSGWVNSVTFPAHVECSDQLTEAGALRLRITDEDGDELYNAGYAQSPTVTVDAGGGARSLTAVCTDEAGLSSSATVNFNLDTTSPSITTFTLNGGAANERTGRAVVNLNFVVADPGGAAASGVSGVSIGETPFTCAAATYVAAISPMSLALSSGDGTKSVYLCVRDLAGNYSGVSATKASNDVVLDTQAPAAPGFTLAGGASSVRLTSVPVAITTSETVTTGLKVRFTGPIVGSPVEVAWAASLANLTLSGGEADYSITAQLVDAAGNVSSPVSRTVSLDTTAPTVTSLVVGSGSGYVTTADGSTTVSVSCSDRAGSGLLTLSITSNAVSIYSGPYASSVGVVLGATEATRSISATCTDPAGNPGTLAAPVSVLVDHSIPTVSGYSVNGGTANEPAGSRNLRVNYSAADGTGSGVTGVALLDVPFACASGNYAYPAVGPATYPVPSDGTKTVYVCARDAAGNHSAVNAVASNAVIVDTQPPAAPGFTISGNPYRKASTMTLTAGLTTSEGSTTGLQVIFVGDITTSGNAIGFQASPTVTITAGDGPKNISAYLRDAAGNLSPPVSRSVVLDTVAPLVGELTVGTNGFVNTSDGSTTAHTQCTDETVPDGLVDLTISTGATVLYNNLPYLPDVPITLGATETTRVITAVCTDAAGNSSAPGNYSVTVDHTAPVVSGFTLLDGTANKPTNSVVVAVSYTTSDSNPISGTAVALADTAFASCSSATFAYPRTAVLTPFVLSAGEGTRSVYLCARDAAGNFSAPATSSNAVNVDTVADSIGTLTLAAGNVATNSASVGLAVTGLAAGSCLCLLGDTASTCYGAQSYCTGGTVPSNITLTGGEGTNLVSAYFRDAAGNESPLFFDDIVYDVTAPLMGRLTLNGNNSSTIDSLSLPVSISGTSADSMRIWEPATATTPCGTSSCAVDTYEPFAASTIFALDGSRGPGTRKVCWHLCDQAGNGSHQEDDGAPNNGNENWGSILLTTYLDRPRPVLASITPTSYTAQSGLDLCGVSPDPDPANPYCMAATGSGIASDTVLLIGDFTVSCTSTGNASCQADGTGNPVGCANTCVVGSLPPELMQRGGTYAVRLSTPDPVFGPDTTSAATLFFTVRAPVPALRSINMLGKFEFGSCPTAGSVASHGVIQRLTNGAPPNDTYCLEACVDGMMDNALFDLGGNIADTLAVNTVPVGKCLTGGTKLVSLAVAPIGLLPSDLTDVAVTISNPNGGEDSQPFGINPEFTDCPLAGRCRSNMRWTRGLSGDGRAIVQGYKTPGQSLFGALAWAGGNALLVRSESTRIPYARASADNGGVVVLPFFAGANGAMVQDSSGSGQLVGLARASGRNRSTGYGFFSASGMPSTNQSPGRLARGDINGDGTPDIAVVNETADTVSVYVVTTNPNAITQTVELPTGNGPADVVLADFDMDGRLDLATGNKIASTTSIRMGNGDGTFGVSRDLPNFVPPAVPSGLGCVRIFARDINRDGTPDLVCVNATQYTVTSMLGTGDGNFQGVNTASATGLSLISMVSGQMADVNGDGFPDVVTIHTTASANRTLGVWINNKNGTFTPPNSTTGFLPCGGSGPACLLMNAADVLVADFNGDGASDVVALSASSITPTFMLRGSGRGDFTYAGTFEDPQMTGSNGTVADVNGDGYPDVVLVNGSRQVRAMLFDPTHVTARNFLQGVGSGFSNILVSPIGAYPAAAYVLAADVNLDGAVDVLATLDDPANPMLVVNFGATGSAVLNPAAQYPTIRSQPRNLLVGDFDRDGATDIVSSTYVNPVPAPPPPYPNGVISMQRYDTSAVPPGFADAPASGSPSCAGGGVFCINIISDGVAHMSTLDYNWDGIPDVVFAKSTSNNVAVSVVQATGVLSLPVDIALTHNGCAGAHAPSQVLVGDVNNDRMADVVVPMQSEHLIVVRRMTAASTFAAAQTTNAGAACAQGPVSAVLGEFNSDGNLDIAMAMTDGSVLVVGGNGTGVFPTTLLNRTGEGATYIVAADLDADGDLDLAWATPNAVRIASNNGAGVFAASVSLGAAANGTVPLAIADFNGDHAPDIIRLRMLTEDGDAQLGDATIFSGTTARVGPQAFLRVPAVPSVVTVMDINQDFMPDYIISSDTDVVAAVQAVPDVGHVVLELADPDLAVLDRDPTHDDPVYKDRTIRAGGSVDFPLASGAMFVDYLAASIRITGSDQALDNTTVTLLSPSGQAETVDTGVAGGAPANCFYQGYDDAAAPTGAWEGHYREEFAPTGAFCARFVAMRTYQPTGNWIIRVANGGSSSIVVADHRVTVGGTQRRLPQGSTKARPYVLAPGTRIVRDTTLGRPDGDGVTGCGAVVTTNGIGPGPGNVYYQFTTSAVGLVTAAAVADFDVVLELRNGTCAAGGAVRQCNDNDALIAGSNNAFISSAATPAGTYCLVVDGLYAGGKVHAGNYQMRLTIP